MPIIPGDPNGCTMCIINPQPDRKSGESDEAYAQRTEEYKKRVKARLDLLRGQDPYYEAMISQLEESQKIYTIKDYGYEGGRFEPNKDGSGGTIYWDIDDVDVFKGEVLQPEQTLAHELSHALDYDNGVYDQMFPPGEGTQVPKGEIKATRTGNILHRMYPSLFQLITYWFGMSVPNPGAAP